VGGDPLVGQRDIDSVTLGQLLPDLTRTLNVVAQARG